MALPPGLVEQRRNLQKLWLRFRLPLAAVAVVAAVAAAAMLALGGGSGDREQRQPGSGQAVLSSAGSAVAKLVATRREIVEAAFAPDAVRALLAAGDAAALEAEAAEIAATDPSILRAWILPAGADETDYATTPPLSYASLDLMRRTGEDGAPPPAEVHLFKEDGQHVAIVHPVLDDAGAVAGYVLAAHDVSILATALQSVAVPKGVVALLQPVPKGAALVLGASGNPALRQGPPDGRVPVAGSAWAVGYWSGAVAPAAETAGEEAPLPLLAAGAALLLLLVGGAVLYLKKRHGGEAQTAPPDESLLEKLAVANRAADSPAATADAAGGEDPGGGAPGPAPAAAPAAVPASIFRAYDIRGVVGKTLTPDLVHQIGRAIGSEAYARGTQTVVVGRDGRESSPELAEAVIAGLRESGRDVIDVGAVPTPLLYFATSYFDTSSGVMVTGSHNPSEYNGLKIMLGGETLHGDSIQALKQRIESSELETGQGTLQQHEVQDEYIRRVSEDIPVAFGNAFKVVVDCGNGIAGDVAPKLIKALGHDVVELHCEVDGRFPNHHPDPSKPENLADLIAAIEAHSADIGFAFDGDGDRLGVVDGAGNIIWPDRQMMLFARDVLSRNAGAEIIFDVKCSSLLPKVIAKLGGKPVMWKTGHSFIKSKLKESGAPLAGEMSGHIFFKERWYGFDDALYAAGRMLEILMGLGAKPAEVFAKLPDAHSTPELRVSVPEGAQAGIMESLLGGDFFGEGEKTTIDGLRVDFADGWGLVRASNTEPSLVLRFEAVNDEALERIKSEFKSVLHQLDGDLELPF